MFHGESGYLKSEQNDDWLIAPMIPISNSIFRTHGMAISYTSDTLPRDYAF